MAQKAAAAKRPTRPNRAVLSYSATLVSSNSNDRLRDFLVTFYAEDSTFVVGEKAVFNSGFRAGRFINRTTAVNPATGRPYRPDEVTLGSEVTINCWRFRLTEASEASLRAMEERPDAFPQSNIAVIVQKIQSKLSGRVAELRSRIEALDPEKSGRVQTVRILEVMTEFGVALTDQESLTIYRKYAYGEQGLLCYGDFLSNFR
jgi:hypothetical protein